MKRYDCLQSIAALVGDAIAVSSAGGVTLEWSNVRPSDANLRVRTLGLCSSIGLGLAMTLPRRKILVLDGDGALLLNLSSLPTLGWQRPPNIHFEVTGKIDKLVTQMYFPGDPLNEKDRILQSSWAQERLICEFLPPTAETEPGAQLAVWDIVIPRG